MQVEEAVAPALGTGTQLVATMYDDLRALARSYCRLTGGRGTIETTGLVHEAYLRLADRTWETRAHFFAVAAKAMRQILIDRARRRRRRIAGSGVRGTLSEAVAPDERDERRDVDMMVLNDALSVLAELDDRKSTALELRYLGGMTVHEIADVRGVSVSTVERDLRFARAWLVGRLRGGVRM